MAMEKTDSRLQNDYGADLWVRDGHRRHHSTQGRGLFAGLQDVKSYNVDNGFAKRKSSGDAQSGLWGFIYSRVFGGVYRAPTN
ncbi:hypothetical protein FE257_006508 [Aspergillus nanangensis]|uniref:Uncharacterized protein n=1 Tax=Aspergillus nanangensis TaxID=2582783 RepID=A0AAD4CXN5_ASPNN|nr:hypothetical protein FE257_006508 [Aspergillus nanangensis]